MRKTLLSAATVALLLLLLAAPASAHVVMMPGEIEPGEVVDAEILVVHGCGPGGTIPANEDDASPTEAVTLEIPHSLEMTPQDSAGWTVTDHEVSPEGATEIRWVADDPDGILESSSLAVSVEAADFADDQELWVPAIQDCVDGEQLSWTIAGMEERDGQLPAMRVGVTVPADDASGLPGWVPVALIVLAAAVAGTVVTVVSGRRS